MPISSISLKNKNFYKRSVSSFSVIKNKKIRNRKNTKYKIENNLSFSLLEISSKEGIF